MNLTTDFVSAFHLGPALSWFSVYGVGLLPLLLLLILCVVGALRGWLGVRANHIAEDSAPPMRAGPAFAVGRVVKRTPRPAMRVEVEQSGTTDYGASDVAIAWHPVNRVVTSNRFDIKMPNGQLLAVQPDATTQLARRFDEARVMGERSRMRASELREDQLVYAQGQLVPSDEAMPSDGGDYRSAPKRGWLLTRSGKRPLVLSVEPLTYRFEDLVTFHKWFGAFTVVTVVLMHAVLFYGYHLREHYGVTEQARITSLERYYAADVKRKQKDALPTLDIHLRTLAEPGRDVVLEASEETFLRVRQDQVIPIRVVPGHPDDNALGSRPTTWSLSPLIALLVVVGAYVAFFVMRPSRRAWWEQPLVERESEEAARAE